MAYVIAEPCIGTKDSACVDACPVDCIHPKKDETGYGDSAQLFIDPVEWIDCGAWGPVLPGSGVELCWGGGGRGEGRGAPGEGQRGAVWGGAGADDPCARDLRGATKTG